MTKSSTGAVAAGHKLTAQAAANVLADGGNAFDAVIAGLWMACFVEPVLASPGGGGFLMARECSEGRTTLFDFFVQTPLAKRNPQELEFMGVHADFGTATQEFHIGHGASAAPGFVPGLYAVHEDLGSMAMDRLLEPAIAAARGGAVTTGFQAFLAEVVKPILTATDTGRARFAPGGTLVAAGDEVTNPGLADFYESLARDGLDFYLGPAAERFVAEQTESGQLRAEDFACYRVERRVPLEIGLGGARVSLNPPPSAGGAFIAHALHGLDRMHEGEAATAARALGAADEARLRCRGDVARMLAEIGIAATIEPDGGTASRGTTHISVIDGSGNAASATVSNGEGNGHIAGGFGFMLNNMLGEEDVNPAGFHQWREGVRPASNMCPAVAELSDGGLVALGSGGSNRIRSAVFQVLVRMVRDGMDPEEAVHAARVHVEGGHLDFEDDVVPETRAALVEAFPDHRPWGERNLFFGGVHAVQRGAGGDFDAAGDARRGGTAMVVG